MRKTLTNLVKVDKGEELELVAKRARCPFCYTAQAVPAYNRRLPCVSCETYFLPKEGQGIMRVRLPPRQNKVRAIIQDGIHRGYPPVPTGTVGGRWKGIEQAIRDALR